MNNFHCAHLYSGMKPVDRVAWILAVATMPLIHRVDESPKYRRWHQRLWDIEIHSRAERIRSALDDMTSRSGQ